MKKTFVLFLFLLVCTSLPIFSKGHYLNNRQPLIEKKYIRLPIGAVKAKGWLQEMLVRQKDGATGHMDVLYPEVMGARNGWLGGDGDQWERGPYWIDGLLPLAYLLDDNDLKAKVQPWVEWALGSQREDGNFGPCVDYDYERGLQRNNSLDWWPRMVVLKILQQYYSATEDKRVIDFMDRYFRYQLATLKEKPLGHWTFWAEYRAADNMQVVHWLYNLIGEPYLLELGDLIHEQSFDFTNMFTNPEGLRNINSIHCVNLAQGLKEPMVYYQQCAEPSYVDAVKNGLRNIQVYHGQAQGMYGGDEGLHGNNPTQGSELCSTVEMMFSLESILEITGDMAFADYLEKVAFNALPTQITDDFMYKQYFQQANQVQATRCPHNFYEDYSHAHTDIVFGTLSGYPCCYSNMHQGWPKFTCNLWFATADNGLAALVYSPSEVTAKVGANATEVTIKEKTAYPMEETITFEIDSRRPVKFPLHLRIPSWCGDKVDIKVNRQPTVATVSDGVAIIDRKWTNGDIVTLTLPMSLRTSRWYENSIALERGPLVYALKMDENWTKRELSGNEASQFGKCFYEVTSDSPWNFGIPRSNLNRLEDAFIVECDSTRLENKFIWNLESCPVSIRTQMRPIEEWGIYNGMAGPLPNEHTESRAPLQDVILVPYGCTTLRVSQFPVLRGN